MIVLGTISEFVNGGGMMSVYWGFAIGGSAIFAITAIAALFGMGGAESGDIDVEAFAEMDYEECVSELQRIKGIGPKVADCVALFAFEHMEAFPIDARISRVMEEKYGVTGSYKTVSEFGRRMFGQYSGYAQEFLYHADFIPQ